MKIAYFDCPFGAGGDMLLAALLDAGVDINEWQTALSKVALPNDSYKLIIEQAQRCSLVAKRLKVLLPKQEVLAKSPAPQRKALIEPTHKHDHEHHHGHDHEHGHLHGHDHKHDHTHEDKNHFEHAHDKERDFKAITVLIHESKISERAKDLAYRIFEKLAQAEGFVHGIDPQAVHFHEVGAVDSIIDILGFAIAYDMLNIEKSIVSALPLGSGTVKTQHGLFPVPGPATLQLLQEAHVPISNELIDYECLTPTAAAILTTIADSWGQAPAMNIRATGSGAGDKNPDSHPNVCRVIIGLESQLSHSTKLNHSSRFHREPLTVIDTMLDDFSPQNLSFIAEKLLELGALDVYVSSVTAKKGRSGHLLTVLCQPQLLPVLEEYIFEQTSTLGLRTYLADRLYLERDWVEVELENNSPLLKESKKHKIRIKLAKDINGKILNVQPEYEDCAKYATSEKLPLKTVLAKAKDTWCKLKELSNEQSNK